MSMVFNRLMGIAGFISPEKIAEDFETLFLEEEQVTAGFKVIRDTFIFTDRRLIIVDIQGMTGRKKEYLSIPYSKITMFSVESAGTFDLEADLKIWVGSNTTPIEKKFNRNVDIYAVQRLLAAATK